MEALVLISLFQKQKQSRNPKEDYKMRYQDNRGNWQQFRSYKHSYSPYDAMTMDKEEVIRKLVLPLAKKLLETYGYFLLATVLRRYGVPEEVIWAVKRVLR